MRRIGTKRCKISVSGQKSRSSTGTTQQNPIGTGTSGTGTTIQNVYGTGTKQSGTGTTLPKMPRFL